MSERTLAKMPGKYRKGTRSGHLKIWLWPLVLVALSLVPGSFFGEHPDFQSLSKGLTSACRERDSLALVALYHATDGPNWNNGWDLERPVNEWTGVYFNQNGCVINLQLDGNNLVGNLPPDLGSLSDLQGLHLSNNKLSGSIPSEIGNIIALESLSVWGNQLSGEIPVALGNLINLKTLFLFENQLVGHIPSEIGLLVHLEKLVLYNNQLFGSIPSSLGNLTELKELTLTGNQLKGVIPASLGNLSRLRVLFLESNQLSGNIPAELSNLDSCYAIWLFDNRLEGCFPELPNLCSIEERLSNKFGSVDRFNTVFLYNNPTLPWSGDFSRLCAGEEQNGAPCDDGDPNTLNDIIRDCECLGDPLPCDRRSDSLEMLRFYQSLGGSEWLIPWDLQQPMDEWYGVTLSEDGCVVCIDLDGGPNLCVEDYSFIGNNLTGIMPDVSLPHLKTLVLNHNQIAGNLPDFTGLVALEEFYIAHNSISGSIPEFSGLQKLRIFDCQDNDIGGSIPNFMIPTLEVLDLHINQLTGPIPDFDNLPGLKVFSCYRNQLTGELPAFNSMSNLEILNLAFNRLSGSIPDYFNLRQLKFLDLAYNGLDGRIPDFNLPNLEVLFFNDCNLTGDIPSFTNLPNLRALFCAQNNLTGMVPDFNEICPDLGLFHFQNNRLTFENIIETLEANQELVQSNDPNWYDYEMFDSLIYAPQGKIYRDTTFIIKEGGNLTIDLEIDNGLQSNTYRWFKDGAEYRIIGGDNGLEIPSITLTDMGTYVVEITNPNAPKLTLESHPIRVVVEDLMSCRERDSLSLVALYNATNGPNWNNRWIQENPMSSWGGVTLNEEGCVIGLNLGHDGGLVGSIPPEIGQLLNLRSLHLEHNQLTGSIPFELGDLSQLTDLFLNNNRLSGTIPTEFSQLTNLHLLVLHSNELNGSIPPELGQLSNLEHLELYGNQLSGSIPVELSQLSNLRELLLMLNQLSGSIPPELGNLGRLEGLGLHFNQLQGGIPQELGNLTNLRVLSLQGNQLTGNIPSSLGNLSELRHLALYANQLSGIIPGTLGNLRKLESAYLNNNLLTGSIPSELNQLDSTYYFNLSNNLLTGCFQDLSNFCTLDERIDTFGQDWLWNIFDFSNNPGLPWSGDFSRFCAGEEQNGAPCDDGDPNTLNDIIRDCECRGEMTTCRERDSLALIALYNATNGPNWTITWNPEDVISTWHGVSLTDEGCVVVLDLHDNNLFGSIAPELGQMENLKDLHLYGNRLSGPIPVELGQLLNLRSLYLNANQLTGTIPPELGNLGRLEDLGLHLNQLQGGIPQELGNLTNLRVLSLQGNQLTGNIPSSLGNLSELRHLALYANQLSGSIPSTLGNLRRLQSVYLDNNNLTGEIPRELGLLDSCYVFLAANNQLSGCFPDLSNFCTIEERLADHFGGLGDFNRVDFSNNPRLPWSGDFSRLCADEVQNGAPCDDGDPNTLNDIIRDCECRGEMTACRERDSLALIALYNATNGPNWTNPWVLNEPMTDWHGVELNEYGCVVELGLNDNLEMKGSIPPEISQLSNLRKLHLYQNALSGPIPTEIGNLSQLEELILQGNQLTGLIPTSLGQLDKLTHLELRVNRLSGNIPEELGNLIHLKTLSLGSNLLTGTIPLELLSLTELTFLGLNINQLTGIIPPGLSQLSNLKYLSLADNLLTGEIPVEISQLTRLEQLNLHGNQLTGFIPPEFGRLVNLRELTLHANQLRGEIPVELGLLDQLIGLNLSFNQLSGEIPAVLGSLNNLRYLEIHSNQLTGSIPSELGQLQNLYILQLYHNQLSGNIPSEIGLLDSCFLFLAFGNQLSGCLPDLSNFCTIAERLSDKLSWHVNFNLVDLSNNPGLPWQGDFSRYCAGENQTGAFCDDGDPNTQNTTIQDCSCREDLCPMGILDPIDIRIHTDCNDPAGNEISVQFGTSLRKVAWWSSAGGNGSTVSFDVSENSTHAYHLRNDQYWLFVESEDGCSDTLPPFDLREDGSIRSIDLADDNFVSEQGEIEIDVLANDRVSVSDLNISLLDANYPTKIQHLGNGVFHAAVPPSDEGVLTATYQVCDNECRMVCDTAAIFIEFRGHCGDPGNYRLPNVITPFDGNGQNDELKLIYNVECPVFIEQISVINRWGDVVWKSTGPNQFWRGLNDRGEALPEGTYYYQVRLSIQGEGVPVMKTGHVTLLR